MRKFLIIFLITLTNIFGQYSNDKGTLHESWKIGKGINSPIISRDTVNKKLTIEWVDIDDTLATESWVNDSAHVLNALWNFLANLKVDTIKSTTSLYINPSGDIVHAPISNTLKPDSVYSVDIGTLQDKYLRLYASELWVETLVAQNTIATIGGRVLVGETNILVEDLSSGATTIHVKYNNFSNGDRAYMEANGKVEFIAITSSYSGVSGDYTYTVTRSLDPSGANDWYAGDAIFNTGQSGSGWIDMYSFSGMKNGAGATIVGNVRNSSTYNDWTESWAIGNLKDLYGYTSDTYGVGLGRYSSGYSNVVIDPTNGYRIRNYTTTLAQWDNSGNILIGQTGAGQSNVYISSGKIALRNNTTEKITLNSDGTSTFTNTITVGSSGTDGYIQSYGWNGTSNGFQIKGGFSPLVTVIGGTITGGTVQTATSGRRVKMASDILSFYNLSGTNIANLYGQVSADNIFSIDAPYGTAMTGGLELGGALTYSSGGAAFELETDPLLFMRDVSDNLVQLDPTGLFFGYFSGYDVNLYRSSANVLRTDDTFDALIYKVNGSVGASGYYLRSNGSTGFTSSAIQASDLPTGIDATKIGDGSVSNTEYQHLDGLSVDLTDYFTPAFGELYDNVATSTITCDGSTYVKWTGSTVGYTSNITGSTVSDRLTINSGHGGKYKVIVSISYEVNTDDTYYWAVLENGSAVGKSRQRQYATTAGDPKPVTVTCILDLAATEYVELGCLSTNTNIVTVKQVNFNITKTSN